jgi:hypothetical protein
MTTAKSDRHFPPLAELVAQTGLYAPIPISDIAPALLFLVLNGASDIYCPECKRMSVFRVLQPASNIVSNIKSPPILKNLSPKPKDFKHEDRDFTLELNCTRLATHRILVIFRVAQDTLIKIGQYPSVADLQLDQLSKYDGVLAESMRKDFARAIGLNAHGIGIGAFVYLRRIFESLIEESHKAVLGEPGWDDDLFQRSKTDDRIRLLKHKLPELLVANAAIYSILSKGIHSLTDDECLEHYATIKLGIELILDEKISREQTDLAKKQLTSEISRIQSKLK